MPRRASAPTALPAGVAAAAASATTNAATPPAAGPSKQSSAVPSPQAGPSTSSTSNPSGPVRQRRIMPSRSRRGGPGVGICDVDTQILETLRRRCENDPLIPAHTQFLLTTNSTRVRAFGDAAGVDGSQLNTSAYERYFDKPEVIRAYREQQVIQTPEFTLLSEHEAVGGRFRPRGLDDEGIDTSDAAYEKRHRKYEAFEKRQRLREKEKLKHEHYKLKERIEQLRALEPSSFLGASDTFFAGSRRPPPHDGEPDAQGSTDAPAPSHNEGEWRKRQMLDVAHTLEARYRTLLDTAPSRAPDLPAPTPPPVLPAVPLAHTPNHAPAVAVRSPSPTSPTALRPQRASPLPQLTEVIELDSDGEEKTPEMVKAEPMPASPILNTTESLKLRIRFPTRLPPSTSPLTATPSSPSSPRAAAVVAGEGSSSPKGSASPSPTRPRPKPIFKNPDAPGPYARVPFVKRITQQGTVAMEPLSPASPTRSLHNMVATPTSLPSGPALTPTHPTLRRRPARTAAPPKPGSPAAAGILTSARPPVLPLPPRANGPSRARKRRRLGPSDDEKDELLGSDSEPDGEADEVAEGAEEEAVEEEEEDEDDGEGGRRARWRESALYREAQRHAGTPSSRKTHRHLGIFGLKGFPAEVEYLRDFVLPEWALPRGDPRSVALRNGDVVVARGAETVTVRAGAGGRVRGGGEGGGGIKGGRQGQRRDSATALTVAMTEDGEETRFEEEGSEETPYDKSDRMVVAETTTSSTVDSQATEELTII
ncbi:hypothetical protein BJV78DRAFT_224666 [Lactifluus subvellereus]|nr:hypothetical protein BJV78DRAFT_224666 [Lactifluus subvellereus]